MAKHEQVTWRGPRWRDVPASICHPTHVENLAPANRFSVFLTLWRMAYGDTSNRWGGLVHGGEPFKVPELAKELGLSLGRCREYLAQLRHQGYVVSAPAGHAGVRMLIRLWPASESPEKSDANRFWDFGCNLPATSLQSAIDSEGKTPKSAQKETLVQSGEIGALGYEGTGGSCGTGALGYGETCAESNSPPHPPYNEFKHKKNKTSNVLLFTQGMKRTPAKGAERPKGKQAPPASRDLRIALNSLPDFERPPLTDSLKWAFYGVTGSKVDLIFESVENLGCPVERMEDPKGWWGQMLEKMALRHKKSRERPLHGASPSITC